LPLQRNEIVSDSRIVQIVDRVRARSGTGAYQPTLFAEMEKALREGDSERRAEWFTHQEGWKNKLICGDSLQVMESLIQHENLRGQVQMIFTDPPYGVKYNSNFQQRVDSTRNDEKDLADDVWAAKPA
jgi:adenine-specific DNA-methyltransferase